MKTKRPIDCVSLEKTAELKTNNHSLKNFWIVTDGFEISLTEQKSGEAPKQSISIPKRQFDALIDWYLEPQPIIGRVAALG